MTFKANVWMHYECVLGHWANYRLCGDSLAGCRLTGDVALIGVNATGTRKAGQTLQEHPKDPKKCTRHMTQYWELRQEIS